MLKILALFLLVPVIFSLYYGSGDELSFLFSALITGVTGLLLSLIKPDDKKFRARDAFAAAALAWIFLSLFGALPYYFCGYFDSFLDCFFESVSGFTTTGASICTDVESLPKGIVFWRSFTHLIGGMGVLTFMLAVLPSMNASSVNLLRAEATGPAPDKILPRISETARTIYIIYAAMTVVLFLILLLTGLSPFDAVIHAFSVAGTGGFSNMNASVGAFNNLAAEIVMSVFMFLFGINFTLYFYLINRKFKQFYKDDELRVYFVYVVASILLIAADLASSGAFGTYAQTLRQASFQVTSLISSTGFFSVNYDAWPDFCRVILLLLMTTGCCAGSTGGGLKVVRFLIIIKSLRNELDKIVHPRGVKVVTINGAKIDNDVVGRVAMIFFCYFAIFTVSLVLLSFNEYDIITNASASISMLSNIGGGFGASGPAGSYAVFAAHEKLILSIDMLAGRLEFIPVFLLLRPSIWMN
jgi:trk system potassium uptake protein TrkH